MTSPKLPVGCSHKASPISQWRMGVIRSRLTATSAQIESAFSLEMHNYAVDGVVHLANAGEPSIPAALVGTVLGVGSLNDFAPKPRAKIQSHLTSYVSGNHFLTPADFATIYNINPLYSAGADGTGQKIAVIGQSTVSATDLNNFRSAAGLPASTVAMTLQGGTATKCPGDEGRIRSGYRMVGRSRKEGANHIRLCRLDLSSGDHCSADRPTVFGMP